MSVFVPKYQTTAKFFDIIITLFLFFYKTNTKWITEMWKANEPPGAGKIR